jgi:lysophospholipid acyltransferase (LPLAT)-like uncharacterized protein
MASRILQRIALPLAGLLGSTAIRLTRLSMRLEYVNREVMDRLREGGEKIILAFWHGQLFMMPYVYPGEQITILVSRHRDGEYISRAMEWFGFATTRGSTTSGGGLALRGMVKKYRQGFDLAFTPDGPRGPRHRVQPGVIQAGRLTGGPIVPVAFDCTKKNFSGAGTGSSCRGRFRPESSSSASRSGSTGAPAGTNSNENGWNWSMPCTT